MDFQVAVSTSACADDVPIELSVVMPCLNEADTLEICIKTAQESMLRSGIIGEIIIADNGSTDGSQEIAEQSGARLVRVPTRGYGSALMSGFAAARGKFILMADSDQSYDFNEIPAFVEKLRTGYDLVMGCRLGAGGGTVRPGAMPFLHRYWGNPMFSTLARWWFHVPVHDIHCGMRGLTRDLATFLDLRCIGMEFASEMLIKAALRKVRITEVPITLYPDGRRAHPPHLKTFSDGWRHLRFFLLFSPKWLFLVPGVFLVLMGLVGYLIALPGVRIAGVRLDVHTLLFSSLAIIAGYQAIQFAAFAKVFGITHGFFPANRNAMRIFDYVDLEKGILAGAVSTAIGLALLGGAVNQWMGVGFGDLDYALTMRWVIPGAMFATIGIQTVLSSFFLSILGLRQR